MQKLKVKTLTETLCLNPVKSKPNVSEFKLSSPYAGFDSIKGRVSKNGKSVIFDGIKYGEANRFEHSTPVVTLGRSKKQNSRQSLYLFLIELKLLN